MEHGQGAGRGVLRRETTTCRAANLTVRAKLVAFALVGAMLTLAVGGAGLFGVRQMQAAATLTSRIGVAQRYHQDADQQHDALRHDLFGAVLIGKGVAFEPAADTRVNLAEHAAQYREDLRLLDQAHLPPVLTAAIDQLRPDLEAYMTQAAQLVGAALDPADAGQAVVGLTSFDELFDQLEARLNSLTTMLAQAAGRAKAAGDRARARAETEILVAGTAAVLALLGFSSLMIRSLLTGLGRLVHVSRAQEEGVVDARAPEGHDEIGRVGVAFNAMADAVGSVRDELVENNRLLDARVRERTANLQEAQAGLVAARDEAQEASRSKSEFLATMSHEIRTPMNGVIGLTGLLLDTELTETQRSHAEGVRGSGEALLGIINDILDFSKIEAGMLELEMVDFDLADAVEDVAALVAGSAQAKGLELVAYCSPDVPTALRGDVGRLRQILLNFATNAVKFTESGEVIIRAVLAEDPTAEQVVLRLEVTDTASVSPRPPPSGSSNRSPRRTPRRPVATEAPAWVWPSAGGWRRPWAAPSASSTRRAGAAVSGSASRSPVRWSRSSGPTTVPTG